MIYFFRKDRTVFAVASDAQLSQVDTNKLQWLFGNAERLDTPSVGGVYVGPRKEMVSPWSTNAVEITQNMGIRGIARIEEFMEGKAEHPSYDPMIQHLYRGLDQDVFDVHLSPEPIREIEDVAAYNSSEGLALSAEEIRYLEDLSKKGIQAGTCFGRLPAPDRDLGGV
jgi:phosphoribosylformylglycinamidine synthase